MIDTHTHIFADEFKNDFLDILKRAKEENIKKMILVGYDNLSNKEVINISKIYDNIYPTCGIHPLYVNENNLDLLEDIIKNNRVYAIGECGLDYSKENIEKEKQKEYFKSQIELSIKYNLPLIIHTRDAMQDTYNILESYKNKGLKGVMHCYTGSYQMAKKFVDLGFYISLSGVLTFKNAKDVKEVASKIDINRLVIETDCPYLTPSPYRGKRNEPSYLKYILKDLAYIKNIDIKELENILDRNSIKLFNISK